MPPSSACWHSGPWWCGGAAGERATQRRQLRLTTKQWKIHRLTPALSCLFACKVSNRLAETGKRNQTKFMFGDELRYDEDEVFAFLRRLRPQGLTGADVMNPLAPEG